MTNQMTHTEVNILAENGFTVDAAIGICFIRYGSKKESFRKHFVLVAEIIKRIENLDERRKMAEFNAGKFANLNPRFNKAKFLAACGL